MRVNGLPHFAAGKVVKGFGRGSKQLGIPTANFSEDIVDSLPREVETGVYYGWAKVNNGPVYKMVMSIGWNPFYQNTKKSMETHILHVFPDDFYDSLLRVCMLGYIRPEQNFESLDELISTIKDDISKAENFLEDEELQKYRNNDFFQDSPS